jgi:hypothetical protein
MDQSQTAGGAGTTVPDERAPFSLICAGTLFAAALKRLYGRSGASRKKTKVTAALCR